MSTVDQLRRGQLVAVPIPGHSRSVLYERKYVPPAIKLLAKPVAAIGGDHVCLRDGWLRINGAVAGTVRETDDQGRPMPCHRLCRDLEPDEVFLATAHDNSFDSRNFGPVKRQDVRGALTALIVL